MLLADFIGPLQLSIGPVILISGIGLIILSLTNRLGRTVDRIRQLSVEYRNASGADGVRICLELAILTRRAKVLRSSNLLAVVSVLMVSFIIIGLFGSALYNLNISYLLMAFFIASIVCLILALFLFIYDIELTLKALWIELPDKLSHS